MFRKTWEGVDLNIFCDFFYFETIVTIHYKWVEYIFVGNNPNFERNAFLSSKTSFLFSVTFVFRSLSKGFLNTTCSKRLFCGTRLPITNAVIRHILCNISTSILKLLFSIFLSSTHRRIEYFVSCRVRKSNIWA